SLVVGSTAYGEARVKVCHKPPGNPANFHTISVGQSAVPAHLAHGDLLGDCSQFCSALCDDGNACTIDACSADGTGCAAVHPAVNCDDSNACTTDSCDPSSGCQYATVSCDDANVCTTDSCDPSSGCVYAPIVCDDGNACTADSCDPSSGCVYALVSCDDA